MCKQKKGRYEIRYELVRFIINYMVASILSVGFPKHAKDAGKVRILSALNGEKRMNTKIYKSAPPRLAKLVQNLGNYGLWHADL